MLCYRWRNTLLNDRPPCRELPLDRGGLATRVRSGKQIETSRGEFQSTNVVSCRMRARLRGFWRDLPAAQVSRRELSQQLVR